MDDAVASMGAGIIAIAPSGRYVAAAVCIVIAAVLVFALAGIDGRG